MSFDLVREGEGPWPDVSARKRPVLSKVQACDAKFFGSSRVPVKAERGVRKCLRRLSSTPTIKLWGLFRKPSTADAPLLQP